MCVLGFQTTSLLQLGNLLELKKSYLKYLVINVVAVQTLTLYYPSDLFQILSGTVIVENSAIAV